MNRAAFQVVDLGFGDSGKGSLVDYLVRREEAELVVRFNGGPQAGHNVVLPDGRHHTFAQFGSGSFVRGVKTLLSRYMLIEPYAMLKEAAHLESIGVPNILRRTFIDDRCLVITPMHQILNRLRERARGTDAHGSCGMGVGECVADSLDQPANCLYAADLRDPNLTRRKMNAMFESKRSIAAQWRAIATPAELRTLEDPNWIDTAVEVYGEICGEANLIAQPEVGEMLRICHTCVFEGAQGVLLDEHFGFHPHTTWSTTTFQNADALLDEAQSAASRRRIGVCRSYLTRHGQGPFPTEFPATAAMPRERHNGDDGIQGRFRRGSLDLVLFRYALAVCAHVDFLAVTHLDCLSQLPPEICDRYTLDGVCLDALPLPDTRITSNDDSRTRAMQRATPEWCQFPMLGEDEFIDALTTALKTPVGIRSRGPTHHDKQTG